MKEFWDYVSKFWWTLCSVEMAGDGDMLKVITRKLHGLGDRNKVFVIGNGGSAAIASHVANDLNTAGVRAMALNDASALTCISNDFGYESVFCKQLEWHGRLGDMLIAISSSGKSENILRAVRTALAGGMFVVTLSGFDEHNKLRHSGHLNFYVPSDSYGFVEMAHHIILHAVTDALMAAEEVGVVGDQVLDPGNQNRAG